MEEQDQQASFRRAKGGGRQRNIRVEEYPSLILSASNNIRVEEYPSRIPLLQGDLCWPSRTDGLPVLIPGNEAKDILSGPYPGNGGYRYPRQ